jgi:hypothetical protein
MVSGFNQIGRRVRKRVCDINTGAVRPLTAIPVSLALLLAFVQAPFLHTHQHEATQRHAGPLFHLHLKLFHATSRGSEFRALDPDDDALSQSWFADTPHDPGSSPVILAVRLGVSAPEHSGWTVGPPPQMGHDPPLLCIKNPRAPPA